MNVPCVRSVLLCLLLSGLLIQSFDFIQQYLNYRTVQMIKIVQQKQLGLPAMTMCDRAKSKFTYWNNRSEIDLYSDIEEQDLYIKKEMLTFTKRKNQFCATLFGFVQKNEIQPNHTSFKTTSLLRGGFYSFSRFGWMQFHSQLMPTQMVDLENVGCDAEFQITVFHRILKLAPYDTDCINYGYKNKNTKSMSQWDCRFQCRLQRNARTLCQCKHSCTTEYYFSKLYKNIDSDICRYLRFHKGIYRFVRLASELFIQHKEEMSALYLLIQLGGLLSFWFGFSLMQISKYVFRKISFCNIKLYYVSIKVSLFLCIYQIVLVFIEYFRFETLTAIQNRFSHYNLFPYFILSIVQMSGRPLNNSVLIDTFHNYVKAEGIFPNHTKQLFNEVVIRHEPDQYSFFI